MGEYPIDARIHFPVRKGTYVPYVKRENILFAGHAVFAIKNVRILQKLFAQSWTEHHLFVMAANRSAPALSENKFIGQRKHKKVTSSFYQKHDRDSILLRLR
jgi:hypothetical protein